LLADAATATPSSKRSYTPSTSKPVTEGVERDRAVDRVHDRLVKISPSGSSARLDSSPTAAREVE